MSAKLKSTLTKIFALGGTILLWGPILFMFLTSIVGSIMSREFLFDYLMLAEVFFIVAPGLALLILASIFARTFVKWFAWGTGAILATLAGGQLLAVASGIASGAHAPSGFAFAVIIAAIVDFNLLIIALAVLGIVLVWRVFSKKPAVLAEKNDGGAMPD